MPRQLTLGDRAPDISLVDDMGQPIRLSELWTRKPLALVFVRHTG